MTKGSGITKSEKNDITRRFDSIFENLSEYYQQFSTVKQATIIVSIPSQALYLFNNKELISNYSISSAEAGIGNLEGSYQTPLGAHRIYEKIGKDAPPASIFKSRKKTYQIATILTAEDAKSDKDNITSRILRLQGLEQGLNKGKDQHGNNVDSFSRYIYIHGTDEEGRLGQPASHGCIRMANQDIIELFEKTTISTLVVITDR